MKTEWSRLSHIQLGKYAEYFVKMSLVSYGFDVYSAEIDDRGIDFIIRINSRTYLDVQVKSSRNLNYVFVKKSNFDIRDNMLLALVLFEDGDVPSLYLIPSLRWRDTDGLFVDRDYNGRSSDPEYGLNLSRKNLPKLEQFLFRNWVENFLKSEKLKY